MPALILSLLLKFWKPIAGLLAGFAAYGKGRSDATQSAKIKDQKNAIDIDHKASEARDAVSRKPAADRLSDDGFKRD